MNQILTVSIGRECGGLERTDFGLERTDFQQFLLKEGCHGLESTHC